MKRIIVTALAALLMAFSMAAQTESVPAQGAALDSTLVGKNIFSLLPSKSKGAKANVSVHQSDNIMKALNNQIASNSSRKVSGYRVRIFNDNKQTSRGASEAALNRFKGMYPGIAAYRTYSNPFFKVTVGDFRTKSEAMQLLQQIKGSFPSAFIVKESAINYPPVGSIY
ncbi:MAG: SPOR domain-containing protein [Bacteroidales bacterium]|nr:SPOR domain-containing protein [Bacteroidales bacterium]